MVLNELSRGTPLPVQTLIMADTQIGEVGVTPTSFNQSFQNCIWLYIFDKYATFVVIFGRMLKKL
jgi:hypothetical protein